MRRPGPPISAGSSCSRPATSRRSVRELQKQYVAARVARFGATANDMVRGLGEQIGKGLEDAGRRLRDSMQDRGGAPSGAQ